MQPETVTPTDVPDEASVELYIQITEIDWEPQKISFPRTTTTRQAVLAIGKSGRIPIEHPEAYGLCFPPSKDWEKWKKTQAKKGMKVGLFRDDTQWLDENHSLEFYKLQNGDTLLFKVKNVHLSRAQKVRVLIPSQNGVEIEVKYDYLTTVRDTIRRLLHIEDTDTEEDDTRWSLLLPTCKVDGLWLDPTRTLASYNLYGKEAMETIEGSGPSLIRLIVLTQKPSVKSKWDEEENVEWWMKLLLINKWNKFDPKENPSKWKKLKAMARKGIPGFLRGDIWPIITGATTIYVPGLYKKLYSQDAPIELKNKIRRDLDRTLPFHPYFQSPVGQEQLYRVLLAFANMEPTMGYCQGTNFIIGVLLLSTNEEMTFWIFVALLRGYNMREFYTADVSHLSSSLQQFEFCVKEMAPEVWDHFQKEMVEMNLIVSSWFLTLFSREGQLEFSQQLWDVFFHEGFSIIFRVAMTILKEGREIEGIRDYFHLTPRLITNPEILLNIAFKLPKNKLMSHVYTKEELKELTKKEKGKNKDNEVSSAPPPSSDKDKDKEKEPIEDTYGIFSRRCTFDVILRTNLILVLKTVEDTEEEDKDKKDKEKGKPKLPTAGRLVVIDSTSRPTALWRNYCFVMGLEIDEATESELHSADENSKARDKGNKDKTKEKEKEREKEKEKEKERLKEEKAREKERLKEEKKKEKEKKEKGKSKVSEEKDHDEQDKDKERRDGSDTSHRSEKDGDRDKDDKREKTEEKKDKTAKSLDPDEKKTSKDKNKKDKGKDKGNKDKREEKEDKDKISPSSSTSPKKPFEYNIMKKRKKGGSATGNPRAIHKRSNTDASSEEASKAQEETRADTEKEADTESEGYGEGKKPSEGYTEQLLHSATGPKTYTHSRHDHKWRNGEALLDQIQDNEGNTSTQNTNENKGSERKTASHNQGGLSASSKKDKHNSGKEKKDKQNNDGESKIKLIRITTKSPRQPNRVARKRLRRSLSVGANGEEGPSASSTSNAPKTALEAALERVRRGQHMSGTESEGGYYDETSEVEKDAGEASEGGDSPGLKKLDLDKLKGASIKPGSRSHRPASSRRTKTTKRESSRSDREGHRTHKHTSIFNKKRHAHGVDSPDPTSKSNSAPVFISTSTDDIAPVLNIVTSTTTTTRTERSSTTGAV